MHEHLLFAPVSAAQYPDVLAQLTGIAAMRPVRVIERRLVFKPFQKSTFSKPPPSTIQSAQDQRLNKILHGAMHYIHAVGPLDESDFAAIPSASHDGPASGAAVSSSSSPSSSSSSALPSGSVEHAYHISQQHWEIQFNDTPIAGSNVPVNTRFASTANLPYGDPLPFLNSMGFIYITEYVVEGYRFIVDDIVLFLHRVLVFPQKGSEDPLMPAERLPPYKAMLPLDSSGSYILQASLLVADGASPDLIQTGADRLLALKDRLKLLVPLELVDRLSLDTRAK